MTGIKIFMCGDVMTGRGIDQILPYPSDPVIHEPYMKSAAGYVELAEEACGPIPKPVDFSYIWGDALEELEREKPDLRIINLETAVTNSDDYMRGKGINYRMAPANIPCITAAKIDSCALANNHVLDWGPAGLKETIETLRNAGIKSAGAGLNLKEAAAPAVMEINGKGRVILFSVGSETSGIPRSWAASDDRPGVNLTDLSEKTAGLLAGEILKMRRPGDIVLVSIHWGGNWGYDVPGEQSKFAHALIDAAGVDIIHGHSSHHVKGIEVFKDRLILYGCGDFLNDYEGIGGYENYGAGLGLMYFAVQDPSTGRLLSLRMTPTRVGRFRVNHAGPEDAMWLRDVLNREGERLGTRVEMNEDYSLTLISGLYPVSGCRD